MDAREHMLMLIPKADAHLHAFFLEILLEVFAQLNSVVHSLYSYIEQTKIRVLKRLCSECNFPLGMEDGRIKDDQITATAHHVDSSAAHFSRLNGVNGAGAWCHSSIDKDERDQYLQVSAFEFKAIAQYQNTLYTAFRLFAPLLTNHFSYLFFFAHSDSAHI